MLKEDINIIHIRDPKYVDVITKFMNSLSRERSPIIFEDGDKKRYFIQAAVSSIM
ncbi:MAG: hypothetical protein QXU63_01975 [Nitrososphaerota archaeon]